MYDRKVEIMSRTEIAELQLSKLKHIVKYAYENVNSTRTDLTLSA